VNAGIGEIGDTLGGGQCVLQDPVEAISEAAEAAGQLADPVDRSIRRLSAQFAFRSEDFPLGPSRLPAPAGALEGQR
jgi:hypothetical protein